MTKVSNKTFIDHILNMLYKCLFVCNNVPAYWTRFLLNMKNATTHITYKQLLIEHICIKVSNTNMFYKSSYL